MSKEQVQRFEEYINRHCKPTNDTEIGIYAGTLASLDILGFKVEMIGNRLAVVAK